MGLESKKYMQHFGLEGLMKREYFKTRRKWESVLNLILGKEFLRACIISGKLVEVISEGQTPLCSH
jgi:hypothetical protein